MALILTCSVVKNAQENNDVNFNDEFPNRPGIPKRRTPKLARNF